MAMQVMRGRLMAYTRGMPGARPLRGELSTVASLAQLDDLIASHLAEHAHTSPETYSAVSV